MSNGQELLDQLLSEDLSGVVFVRDYLQLQFNPPPTLNVYSACRVVTAESTATFGDTGFANLIISQIGKDVVEVMEQAEVVIVGFADGTRIEIPTTGSDSPSGEALVMFGRDSTWGVWPG